MDVKFALHSIIAPELKEFLWAFVRLFLWILFQIRGDMGTNIFGTREVFLLGHPWKMFWREVRYAYIMLLALLLRKRACS